MKRSLDACFSRHCCLPAAHAAATCSALAPPHSRTGAQTSQQCCTTGGAAGLPGAARTRCLQWMANTPPADTSVRNVCCPKSRPPGPGNSACTTPPKCMVPALASCKSYNPSTIQTLRHGAPAASTRCQHPGPLLLTASPHLTSPLTSAQTALLNVTAELLLTTSCCSDLYAPVGVMRLDLSKPSAGHQLLPSQVQYPSSQPGAGQQATHADGRTPHRMHAPYHPVPPNTKGASAPVRSSSPPHQGTRR